MPETEQPPPMATPRVAAGALFLDDTGNVLLVKPAYKDGWDIPGGYVEPGETPIEACEREVREELGIQISVRRLLVVDWAPSESEGDKVLFVFDGGKLNGDTRGQLTVKDAELTTHGFHAPAQFDELMPARLAKRIRAALSASAITAPQYLEHGQSRD